MLAIGVAFALVAVYVLVESLRTLVAGSHAETSAVGTLWVAATVVDMLALAAGKHQTGTRLGNVVLATEARVTLIDAYLAASVLFGLLLNAALDWWWANPVAALVIVYYAAREGVRPVGRAKWAMTDPRFRYLAAAGRAWRERVGPLA